MNNTLIFHNFPATIHDHIVRELQTYCFNNKVSFEWYPHHNTNRTSRLEIQAGPMIHPEIRRKILHVIGELV